MTPYQLLDDRSSDTSLVFWVKNETDANSPAFINDVILATMRGPAPGQVREVAPAAS